MHKVLHSLFGANKSVHQIANLGILALSI